MTAQWTAVVPLLNLAENSSRLGAEAEQLTRAIALDTVAAIAQARAVARIVVVSDTPELTAELTSMGANITVATVASGEVFDLAAALHAAHAPVSGAVAVIRPVLPALDPAELTTLLDAAQDVPVGVVSDTEGRRATVLTAQTADDLGTRPDMLKPSITAQAAPLAAGTTLRRTVTTARHLVQVRAWPTLGARTKAAAHARHLSPRPTDRRYGIDPPAND